MASIHAALVGDKSAGKNKLSSRALLFGEAQDRVAVALAGATGARQPVQDDLFEPEVETVASP